MVAEKESTIAQGLIFHVAIPKSRADISSEVFRALTLSMAFCIPLFTRVIMIPLTLWVIMWFFTPKRSVSRFFWPVLVFGGLYLMHVCGLTYTENLERGWDDLEQKLSLLAFPILLGSVRSEALPSRKQLSEVFVAGVIAAVLWAFLESVVKYQHTANMLSFYMSEFSPVHHPSYISLYMNVAIAMIFVRLYDQGMDTIKEQIMLLAAALLSFALVFPASKMGILQFAFLLIYFLFMAFRQKRILSRVTLGLVACGAALGVGFVTSPMAGQRFQGTMKVVAADESAAADLDRKESTASRLTAWSVALEAIREHPFGVGTGDINDEMVGRFRAQGFNELADANLNPHNNFLQVTLALGIQGLLLFLYALFYPFRRIFKQNDWIYAFFILSMLMHFSVESLLEKQSGVVFFTFFNAFFFFSSEPTHEPSDS